MSVDQDSCLVNVIALARPLHLSSPLPPLSHTLTHTLTHWFATHTAALLKSFGRRAVLAHLMVSMASRFDRVLLTHFSKGVLRRSVLQRYCDETRCSVLAALLSGCLVLAFSRWCIPVLRLVN
jgi:hypothetical protein